MNHSNHRKKMIAPIIVTILVVLYCAFYCWLLINEIDISVLGLIFGVIPIVIGWFMIYVCIQRIKEIQEGEEDDLSKY